MIEALRTVIKRAHHPLGVMLAQVALARVLSAKSSSH